MQPLRDRMVTGEEAICRHFENRQALVNEIVMTMQRTIPAQLACLILFGLPAAHAQEQPNIVLVFMDNFGWGEPGFNGGGIIRGAATPRMDTLASEGLRLTNFNVESQCTPSRAAIMSGRYAIRTGNGTIPLGGGVSPVGLFRAAVVPTLIVFGMFMLFR